MIPPSPSIADSGIPVWPISSFTLLFAGFLVVVIVLVVSGVVLAKIQRAERERRIDAQIEADRTRQRQAALEAETEHVVASPGSASDQDEEARQ